jgi:hypothetical protein
MFRRISEEDQIRMFLDIYREATGESLTLLANRDRPDFLCRRQTGDDVGVEVTIVTRPPHESFFEDALNGVRTMDADEASAMIFDQAQRKDILRNSPGWHLPNNCILLLSIPNCLLSDLSEVLLAEDFQDNGFEEIWIADHTDIEEYGEIELFGIKPLKYWGSPSPGSRQTVRIIRLCTSGPDE